MKAYRQHIAYLIIAYILVVPLAAFAQMPDIILDQDTAKAQEWYAENAMEVDFFLKKKACEEALKNRPRQLEKELIAIDSMIAAGAIKRIPENLAKGVLKVDTGDFESQKCIIYILYVPKQFFLPCQEPFTIDPTLWGEYEHLSEAIEDGRVCLMKVPPSGFTQVNTIPKNISITQESADKLLGTIERMLDLYPNELKVSFPEYVQYEEGKSLSGLKDLILLRVKFIDYCMKKIKA